MGKNKIPSVERYTRACWGKPETYIRGLPYLLSFERSVPPSLKCFALSLRPFFQPCGLPLSLESRDGPVLTVSRDPSSICQKLQHRYFTNFQAILLDYREHNAHITSKKHVDVRQHGRRDGSADFESDAVAKTRITFGKEATDR
jgi:hypothetical protein